MFRFLCVLYQGVPDPLNGAGFVDVLGWPDWLLTKDLFCKEEGVIIVAEWPTHVGVLLQYVLKPTNTAFIQVYLWFI